MPSFQTGYIEDYRKRSIAFCKKKKDVLKRLMDLSISCNQHALLVVYDEEQKRMVYYSSSHDFDMMRALDAKKTAKDPKNISMYERFTNNDYDAMFNQDFRHQRYRKTEAFAHDSDDEVKRIFETTKVRR